MRKEKTVILRASDEDARRISTAGTLERFAEGVAVQFSRRLFSPEENFFFVLLRFDSTSRRPSRRLAHPKQGV
jgi:hypothetical protein